MSHFVPKHPKITIPNVRLTPLQPSAIQGVSTSTAAFLGETQIGPTTPTLVTSWLEYQTTFGSYFGDGKFLPYAVEGFFLNGGQQCYIRRIINTDYAAALADIEVIDEISIVYSPNAQAVSGLADLLIDHCERLKNRFVIFDSIKGQEPANISRPRASSFAALYYPWINVNEDKNGRICLVAPGGHVAGIYARTDAEYGVNKAPANQVVEGAVSTEFSVSQSQLETLNIQGINSIRVFPDRGIMVWGARTLSADPETEYVSVRRMLIYLEQSISKGLSWTTFELNNESTWAKVRATTDDFLNRTWQNGMLAGTKPQDAYFVSADRTTMTQNDVDNGRLIVVIGVALLKPAEFIILRIALTTMHT